jgi:hypothetical protein
MANEPGKNIHDPENSNQNPPCPQLKRSKRNSVRLKGTPEMKKMGKNSAIRNPHSKFGGPYLSKP